MPVSNADLLHYFERINGRMAQIHSSVTTLEVNLTLRFDTLEARMSEQFDRLVREVDETKEQVEKVRVFTAGLSEEIRRLRTDPAALDELATRLDQQQQTLANIMAPEPGPEPAPGA